MWCVGLLNPGCRADRDYGWIGRPAHADLGHHPLRNDDRHARLVERFTEKDQSPANAPETQGY